MADSSRAAGEVDRGSTLAVALAFERGFGTARGIGLLFGAIFWGLVELFGSTARLAIFRGGPPYF